MRYVLGSSIMLSGQAAALFGLDAWEAGGSLLWVLFSVPMGLVASFSGVYIVLGWWHLDWKPATT